MAKIILARESDKGQKQANILIWLVTAMVGGFGGIPIGAILSAVMQVVLKDSPPEIMYGFFAAPIILGMLIAFLYVKKDSDIKDYTKCSACKNKMKPMIEMDTLFYIPAEGEQKYDNPLQYLAANMVRISAIREIPAGKRGCYVCVYACQNCMKRLVRISDFLPDKGTCHWKETYYYDFNDFIRARQRNDLI